jgi:hypothetical protein
VVDDRRQVPIQHETHCRAHHRPMQKSKSASRLRALKTLSKIAMCRNRISSDWAYYLVHGGTNHDRTGL